MLEGEVSLLIPQHVYPKHRRKFSGPLLSCTITPLKNRIQKNSKKILDKIIAPWNDVPTERSVMKMTGATGVARVIRITREGLPGKGVFE